VTHYHQSECAMVVTQSFPLLYRGFSIPSVFAKPDALDGARPMPTESRRYGRLQVCSTTKMHPSWKA